MQSVSQLWENLQLSFNLLEIFSILINTSLLPNDKFVDASNILQSACDEIQNEEPRIHLIMSFWRNTINSASDRISFSEADQSISEYIIPFEQNMRLFFTLHPPLWTFAGKN